LGELHNLLVDVVGTECVVAELARITDHILVLVIEDAGHLIIVS
jgi:hypothetical protein